MQIAKWSKHILVAASCLLAAAPLGGCGSNSAKADSPISPDAASVRSGSVGGGTGDDSATGGSTSGATGGGGQSAGGAGSSVGGAGAGDEAQPDGSATTGSSVAGSAAGATGDETESDGSAATGSGGGSGGGEGGVPPSGDASLGTPSPNVTKDGEGLLTQAGLAIVSYGGYLNGESFQQEGIITFHGYQYAAFWNTARHVVLGRRLLPTGTWSTIEFTDYTNSEDDAHNTISIGICPGDGTIHLSFDHHVSNLHYRKSVAGLASNPTTMSWATSSFGAVTSSFVGTTAITQVTYPHFLAEPDGMRMLFETRLGGSGNGDEYLWEYDGASHAWTSLGRFINGTLNSVNAYLHGFYYTKGGTRLHASWCWRDTPDAGTNHDLLYVYSDDDGRTWKNTLGTPVATTGTTFITEETSGLQVWSIATQRGLINTEHMIVDAAGGVHVLLSHMLDSEPDAAFTDARTRSQYFHYYRSPSGTWTRTTMGFPSIANFRGKLAISSSGNLYAVLPDLRIAAASVASNFTDWTLLNTADSGRFFSDPLIDIGRLLLEDKLSIMYPLKNSSSIYVLEYTLR